MGKAFVNALEKVKINKEKVFYTPLVIKSAETWR